MRSRILILNEYLISQSKIISKISHNNKTKIKVALVIVLSKCKKIKPAHRLEKKVSRQESQQNNC